MKAMLWDWVETSAECLEWIAEEAREAGIGMRTVDTKSSLFALLIDAKPFTQAEADAWWERFQLIDDDDERDRIANGGDFDGGGP